MPLIAQPVEPPNGPRRLDPAWHALVHVTLIPEPGQRIEDATIVFRDGIIQSVQPGGAVPEGARVWDCKGLTVYPGLIEPYYMVDAARPDAKAPGTHWNAHIMAQRSALDGAGIDSDARKKLRAMGYVAAAAAPKGGILRGTGAVVSLAEQGTRSDPLANVLRHRAFHTAGLEVNRLDERGYPNSKMGAIALLRQTLADVPWHKAASEAYGKDPSKHERPGASDALVVLQEPLPMLFDVENELDAIRVAKIAKEYEREAMIVGIGTEFRRQSAIVSNGLPLIVPLAYPDRPVVTTEADRESVDLRQLMTWEAAPSNVMRLDAAGARVAITSSKMPKDQKFDENLRLAIKAGLSEDKALAMMTTVPAELMGIEKRFGRIAPGMNASFVVVDGTLFEKDRKIRDVWIDGLRHEVTAAPRVELEGMWNIEFAKPDAAEAAKGTLKITKKNEVTFERPETAADVARDAAKEKDEKKDDKPAVADAKPADAAAEPKEDKPAPKRSFTARNVRTDENRLAFVLDGEALDGEGVIMVSGIAEEAMSGTAVMPDGRRVSWSASRGDDEKKDEKKAAAEDDDTERFVGMPESFGLPFGPFAMESLPPQQDVWVLNATIWTSGPQGIIEGGSMHVSGGKIVAVLGAGQSPSVQSDDRTVVIDAKGKHITPGLIDCHSHTGISGGVNEGTQSCTAEVRIFDCIDPDAIGWYRELAGGLTAVNQLHGSANAIGGQNSVVKLRWGVPAPDDMRLEGAIGGIKFALGENVKQSNWGAQFNTRYPQTRMGVETYIRDRFIAAKEYDRMMNEWKKTPENQRGGLVPPRVDLELEALAEILRGERLIHCHSYRQDEILMLCRVAEEFGFTIGTFQHVLEGYKVAEAIREHAIGGSAFSDWWAYKFEVVDAIPYAGAIMHDAGVNVSFNSDSDELARRMNLEAAKAVKYGGIDPQEALKFVTLNPAKQLKIDHRVGSLEVGKDADFVVWSGSPLSTFSRCEATYVDGREMFSLATDATMRARNKADRHRIIQKLLSKPKKSEKKDDEEKAKPNSPESIDEPPLAGLRSGGRGFGLTPVGDDIEAARDLAAKRALERNYVWMVMNGLDPMSNHGGECGCSMTCYYTN